MKSDWILVKIYMLLSRLVFIREVCSLEMQYVIKVKEVIILVKEIIIY